MDDSGERPAKPKKPCCCCAHNADDRKPTKNVHQCTSEMVNSLCQMLAEEDSSDIFSQNSEYRKRDYNSDKPSTSSPSVENIDRLVTSQQSKNLIDDINKSLDLLQDFLNSRQYPNKKMKKYYAKKIMNKILESKYDDENTDYDTSSSRKSTRSNSRKSSSSTPNKVFKSDKSAQCCCSEADTKSACSCIEPSPGCECGCKCGDSKTDWKTLQTTSEKHWEERKNIKHKLQRLNMLTSYASKEKEYQLEWIKNEIMCLSKLKEMLESATEPPEIRMKKTSTPLSLSSSHSNFISSSKEGSVSSSRKKAITRDTFVSSKETSMETSASESTKRKQVQISDQLQLRATSSEEEKLMATSDLAATKSDPQPKSVSKYLSSTDKSISLDFDKIRSPRASNKKTAISDGESKKKQKKKPSKSKICCTCKRAFDPKSPSIKELYNNSGNVKFTQEIEEPKEAEELEEASIVTKEDKTVGAELTFQEEILQTTLDAKKSSSSEQSNDKQSLCCSHCNKPLNIKVKTKIKGKADLFQGKGKTMLACTCCERCKCQIQNYNIKCDKCFQEKLFCKCTQVEPVYYKSPRYKILSPTAIPPLPELDLQSETTSVSGNNISKIQQENENPTAYYLTFQNTKCKNSIVQTEQHLQNVIVQVTGSTPSGDKNDNWSYPTLAPPPPKKNPHVRCCKCNKPYHHPRKVANANLSLQEHLCMNRQDFIKSAEWRRQNITETLYLREQKYLSGRNQLFSAKQIKEITRRHYRPSDASVEKVKSQKRKQQENTNRIMASYFSKVLQKKTLKGELNLPITRSITNLVI